MGNFSNVDIHNPEECYNCHSRGVIASWNPLASVKGWNEFLADDNNFISCNRFLMNGQRFVTDHMGGEDTYNIAEAWFSVLSSISMCGDDDVSALVEAHIEEHCTEQPTPEEETELFQMYTVRINATWYIIRDIATYRSLLAKQ